MNSWWRQIFVIVRHSTILAQTTQLYLRWFSFFCFFFWLSFAAHKFDVKHLVTNAHGHHPNYFARQVRLNMKWIYNRNHSSLLNQMKIRSLVIAISLEIPWRMITHTIKRKSVSAFLETWWSGERLEVMRNCFFFDKWSNDAAEEILNSHENTLKITSKCRNTFKT